MKETTAIDAIERSAESEGFANRKLIRPVLHRSENGRSENGRPEHGPNHGSVHVNHAPNHAPNHGNGSGHGPNHGSHHVSNQSHGAPIGDRRGGGGKKTPPAETTHAENFYYQKQMQSKTQMVVVLRDGEEVHGCIEWYDRSCLKLNRLDGPNLMIYKPSIKYMYKEGEAK
jgi:host factor-I protein